MAQALAFNATCCLDCDDPVTVNVPGPSGIATGVVDPEGSVTAIAPKLYWNSANQTLWIKNSGTGNTGWIQLI